MFQNSSAEDIDKIWLEVFVQLYQYSIAVSTDTFEQ